MKAFTRDKYMFVGIQRFKGRCYFGFKNIQEGYSEEIVLVLEAKLIYPHRLGYTYFHKEELPDYFLVYEEPTAIPQTNDLSRLYRKPDYAVSLAENERKWVERRPTSEVVTLTEECELESGAARQTAITHNILNGILGAL